MGDIENYVEHEEESVNNMLTSAEKEVVLITGMLEPTELKTSPTSLSWLQPLTIVTKSVQRVSCVSGGMHTHNLFTMFIDAQMWHVRERSASFPAGSSLWFNLCTLRRGWKEVGCYKLEDRSPPISNSSLYFSFKRQKKREFIFVGG